MSNADEARKMATDIIESVCKAAIAPMIIPPCDDEVWRDFASTIVQLFEERLGFLSTPPRADETVDLEAEIEKIIHAQVEVEDDEVMELCLSLEAESVMRAAKQISAILSRRSAPVQDTGATPHELLQTLRLANSQSATPVPASVQDTMNERYAPIMRNRLGEPVFDSPPVAATPVPASQDIIAQEIMKVCAATDFTDEADRGDTFDSIKLLLKSNSAGTIPASVSDVERAKELTNRIFQPLWNAVISDGEVNEMRAREAVEKIAAQAFTDIRRDHEAAVVERCAGIADVHAAINAMDIGKVYQSGMRHCARLIAAAIRTVFP